MDNTSFAMCLMNGTRKGDGKMDIEKVAEAVKTMAYMFTCSYKTAWEQYMHPAITEQFKFEQVMEKIQEDERL